MNNQLPEHAGTYLLRNSETHTVDPNGRTRRNLESIQDLILQWWVRLDCDDQSQLHFIIADTREALLATSELLLMYMGEKLVADSRCARSNKMGPYVHAYHTMREFLEVVRLECSESGGSEDSSVRCGSWSPDQAGFVDDGEGCFGRLRTILHIYGTAWKNEWSAMSIRGAIIVEKEGKTNAILTFDPPSIHRSGIEDNLCMRQASEVIINQSCLMNDTCSRAFCNDHPHLCDSDL